MKTAKRFLALLLVLAMTLSNLPVAALADELDVTTSERKAVIEQLASEQTRSFTVANGDMITVSSSDSSKDKKYVDGNPKDWDVWTDTEDWLKGE